MPIIPEVKETFEKLIKLHEMKNNDYTGDKGPYFNFEFAEYFTSLFTSAKDRVYATIVGIKLARLMIVLTKAPNYESALDTFDDIIVYMAIWKAEHIVRNKK